MAWYIFDLFFFINKVFKNLVKINTEYADFLHPEEVNAMREVVIDVSFELTFN